MVLTAADGEGVAIGKNHVEAADVIPGGPVTKTTGAGGITVHHAAQCGGGLCGIRREKPVLPGQQFLKAAEQDTGLDHCGPVSVIGVCQHLIHGGEVDHQTAVGDGTRGDTGAATLKRDGGASVSQQ